MASATLRDVRFAGMATCVPRRVVSNLLDCRPQQRAERERLVRNIGIEFRRLANPWQCFSDLAYIAAEALLEKLQWAREEVDALIVVTQSPDYLIPATACILQDRLRLRTGVIAFDVNLGCSGYPFGINVLGSLIATGGVRKGLLLVGDRCASLEDPIFSDAGTATALEFSPGAPPMFFDLNTDGSGYKAIMLPAGGGRDPFNARHLLPVREDENGRWHYPDELILDGTEVLAFSTRRVPPAVEAILAYAGAAKEEVDWFVFHQANRMINETIRRKLALPEEKVPSTLRDFGNSSGASLPVTITARLREALSTAGKKRLLLSGFGVGLSWGNCLVTLENAVFPELLET
ncbi:MAG: ketoacyl-ACP synthase III [Zoogloeaceae bacterium]|jgi:3-oxoacyl-[acyl-carrier-protein] synthase-3|nr:ketoacyl-ACP synthase III [Zoogloeaceae bacterium]